MSDTLGGFLADLMAKVEHGAPPDACVLCESTSALLHPVGRAWACSRCHTPPRAAPGEMLSPPPRPGDVPSKRYAPAIDGTRASGRVPLRVTGQR